MDVTGLVLSVASAASLFITCIECFDIVVKGKNFSEDYEQLYTLFSIQRTRFGLWGESVGLIPDPYGVKRGYNTNLDRPDIRPLVAATLNNIRLLLQKANQVDDKYTLDAAAPQGRKVSEPQGLQVFKAPFDRFRSQIKRTQKETSTWKVTQWAIHDEAKLRGIIDRLREYVDGLESITSSLGLWADQQARLKDEIENISDVESLKLLRDSNSGNLITASQDISDTASRRLVSLAESIFEQKALEGSVIGREDDSFVTAYSTPSTFNPRIPGSWPKSISSAILGPRLVSNAQPAEQKLDQKNAPRNSCKQCLKAVRDCESGDLPQCSNCTSFNLDCSWLVDSCRKPEDDNLPVTDQDENMQMPQNQRWVAEIMQKAKPHVPQSFEMGEANYGKCLSVIKAEDGEHCQNTSVKLIAQAEVGLSSAKRMFLELRNIRTGKVPFVSATPVGDSLDKVLASIEGPLETPYEGGVFWITIRLSQKDSLGPPLMKFQTRVYHPNISPQGHICADFGDKWNAFRTQRHTTNVTSMWYRGKSSTPQWTLGALLTAICGLLAAPDVDDPLVPEIAQKYLEDYAAYCENARLYTKRYATGQRPEEASLSFLEEEAKPFESGVTTEPDSLDLDQSDGKSSHECVQVSNRIIQDYEDQYPGGLLSQSCRASENTYEDSDSSEDELSDDATSFSECNGDSIQDYSAQGNLPNATGSTKPQASNPSNFAKYFHSQRKLLVRHNDSVIDGDANIRVDTEIEEDGHLILLTLFHVKINDLRSRKLSVRRYERHSGREVCHTGRGRQLNEKSTSEQATWSDVLTASRAYSRSHRRRTSSVSSARSRASSLKSVPEESATVDDDDDQDDAAFSTESAPQGPANTIQLEFSNYAQVKLIRRGKMMVRYEFEYWGSDYTWRRNLSDHNAFHLQKIEINNAIAGIVPETRTPDQIRDADKAGHLVPPC
ncbi:uncharacterized protein LY89DRAFT_487318 [Mollisia scopiformis]|uniref:UBC core domain-containing protein n=1 Tax=Mollisia scopiformis TaxID=149040 RepID=A0A194XGJ0_MOLSC|nr:uncharacterized protein LY89DRAFT_487318 [Mollisia scopiformis]KUJ19256.1 hypothetical protein LY89DRAFT_487318 [Mollisia scopiformis]